MCSIPVELQTVENSLFSKFFKFLYSYCFEKWIIFHILMGPEKKQNLLIFIFRQITRDVLERIDHI